METMTNKHLRIYRTQKGKVENIVHITEKEKLSTLKFYMSMSKQPG
jgi:hypothetical protein